MEKWEYFQQHEKYRYHIARPKEAVKMFLACVLLECFHNFSLNPYYEPQSWFMMTVLVNNVFQSLYSHIICRDVTNNI